MAAINVCDSTCLWKKYLVNFDLVPEEEDVTDYRAFLQQCKPALKEKINEMMDEQQSAVTFCCQLKVMFTKPEVEEGETPDRYFNHSKMYFFKGSTMEWGLNDAFEQIQEGIEEFQERGSGWTVDRVDHLQVHLNPTSRFVVELTVFCRLRFRRRRLS